jgi:hypothetical protein
MTLDIVKKSAGWPAGGKICQIVTTLLSDPIIYTQTQSEDYHETVFDLAAIERASGIPEPSQHHPSRVLATKLPATTAPQATSRCGVFAGKKL